MLWSIIFKKKIMLRIERKKDKEYALVSWE